ncbi:unnamed protein product [Pieris brassicae]|uniref:Uncharacterized protein n=1 Tax=Pieris brassicae TaxID=7116 RepID=A0A9P0TBU9_PIEBR|nr:unnamed protein product [Pieris brassicae]
MDGEAGSQPSLLSSSDFLRTSLLSAYQLRGKTPSYDVSTFWVGHSSENVCVCNKLDSRAITLSGLTSDRFLGRLLTEPGTNSQQQTPQRFLDSKLDEVAFLSEEDARCQAAISLTSEVLKNSTVILQSDSVCCRYACYHDAFSRCWQYDLAWIFPPPALLPRVLQQLNLSQGNFIITHTHSTQVEEAFVAPKFEKPGTCTLAINTGSKQSPDKYGNGSTSSSSAKITVGSWSWLGIFNSQLDTRRKTTSFVVFESFNKII